MLIQQYGISESKVSLIYNPIDRNRFNSENINKMDKYSGIFVGEVLDPIRFNAISHLVEQCIKNDWDLYIMSESRFDFDHPNIKYLDKRWDTENIVKRMHFTAGILLGRTTIESWMCGKKSWIYNVDKSGGILNKELVSPPQDINKFYGSTVCEKLVDSYLDIINETSN
jgi:hypothetical protein